MKKIDMNRELQRAQQRRAEVMRLRAGAIQEIRDELRQPLAEYEPELILDVILACYQSRKEVLTPRQALDMIRGYFKQNNVQVVQEKIGAINDQIDRDMAAQRRQLKRKIGA